MLIFTETLRKKKIETMGYLMGGLLVGLHFILMTFSLYPIFALPLVLGYFLGNLAFATLALMTLSLSFLLAPTLLWVNVTLFMLTLLWIKRFYTLRSSVSYFIIFFALDFILREFLQWGETTRSLVASGIDLGIMMGVFILGVWFLENFFRKTFFIKLLELSNPRDKLLMELKEKAPGTYHHSLLVATIASYTSQKIKGADPLLAQVGGQFHDIGKMFHASSFVENQYGEIVNNERTRDHILAHTTSGIEIAKKYHLPQAVQDIIATHHGDSVTSFYTAEMRKASSKDREKIKLADFRYPGPKPWTHEQVIIMLADSTEAAVRSKGKRRFTHEEIATLVDEIVGQKIQQRQFDESPLTGSDLAIVRDSFVEILTAIHHARVDNTAGKYEKFD